MDAWFDMSNPAAFWLDITNIALAGICLVCLTLVISAALKVALSKAREPGGVLAPVDLHTLVIPQLGTTMADGGEPVDEETPEKTDESTS